MYGKFVLAAGVVLAAVGIFCIFTTELPVVQIVCGALTNAALLLFGFLILRGAVGKTETGGNRDRILFLLTAGLACVNTWQCWTHTGLPVFRTVCLTAAVVLLMYSPYSRLNGDRRMPQDQEDTDKQGEMTQDAK